MNKNLFRVVQGTPLGRRGYGNIIAKGSGVLTAVFKLNCTAIHQLMEGMPNCEKLWSGSIAHFMFRKASIPEAAWQALLPVLLHVLLVWLELYVWTHIRSLFNHGV